MRALDEIVVPIPSIQDQSKILTALDKLDLVHTQRLTDVESVWSDHQSTHELMSRINAYVGDEDLVNRLRRWPNPIASAAWMVETAEARPESQEKALVRFWEAVSGFHATLLLSAIQRIPDLETGTLAAIRDGIAQAKSLDLAEASLGAFSLISSTCAHQIRTRIHQVSSGRNDERPTGDEVKTNQDLDQIVSAFGGLSLDLLQQLISRDVARLFDEVRPFRTTGAHGGLESPDQLSYRVSKMRELILQWDGLTRRVWSNYVLVRGGILERLDDHYLQEVEFVVGNDYPFLRDRVPTFDAMKSGYLYMYSLGSSDFMELRAPLFEFVEVPEDAKIACYYFNRLRGQDLDLKSFVYPRELQGPGIAPRIGRTVQWLLGD